MKCQLFFRSGKMVLLAGSLASLIEASPLLAATDNTPLPASPPAAREPAPPLSPPVREVVKMVDSGVPETVVQAYIESFPSTYNLTPENIIHLQEIGISSTLATAMLNHDKMRRDLNQPPSAPSIQPQAPPASELVNDYNVYDNLAPYGYWNELPDYGWCWQPYSWVGYSAYPWAWLGFGYWWSCPGRGWCWSPRSHFRAFSAFGGGGLVARHGFAGGRSGTGQFHSQHSGQSLGYSSSLERKD